MNLISLLVLPAVIVLQDSSARYWIAGISLAILLTAITWSKRQPSVGAISGEPVEPAKV
jgi:hypothetical protein